VLPSLPATGPTSRAASSITLVSPTASWSWGNLGFVATGAAGAFGTDPSDRLVELIYALKAGHRQNGRFVMNRKTQALIRKFKDADGNYLWMPPAGAGQAASLMGFPVVEAEDMPDVAAPHWRWPSATSAAATWWSTGPGCASVRRKITWHLWESVGIPGKAG
jgi:predicted phage gp36 major capsid-like protein